MPTAYLPKKRRIKVEGSGKPKLPATGTADVCKWWDYNIKKKERNKNKKLQEEKKIS